MLQVLVMQWPRHGNDPSSWCAATANLSMSTGTTAAFLTPSQLSTADSPSRRKSQHRGFVFRGIFATFDLGWVPLPSPLELFNLEGQRRKDKVRCVYLERECFGGKVWETAGELVLTEGGKAQKWLRRRPGRRGRAELWEWRNLCGCSELLNSSQAPGQDQWLPAVMSSLCSLSWHSSSHPPLTAGPRALSFLPSVPTGHILCLSL